MLRKRKTTEFSRSVLLQSNGRTSSSSSTQWTSFNSNSFARSLLRSAPARTGSVAAIPQARTTTIRVSRSTIHQALRRDKSSLRAYKESQEPASETPHGSQYPFLYFIVRPGVFALSIAGLSMTAAEYVRKHYSGWRAGMKRKFSTQIVLYSIIGANALVFAAWQIPSLFTFMARNFLHVPASGYCRTLVTSAFSHHSFLHFAANMYVLNSWGSVLALALGPELFAGFCLSSAVFSNYFAHSWNYLIARNYRNIPSLGASGIACAVLAATVYLVPQSHLGIIFLPFSFEVSKAFPFILSLEALGMLWTAAGRYSPLGHSAHFGGFLFGWWAMKYLLDPGLSFLESLRKKRIYPFQ